MKHITDIHMHVIPGVDDGSRNLEESITMLRMSANQGVGAVVATPHSWYIDGCGYDYMLSQYEDLEEAVIERKVCVQLHLGCEMLVFAHTVDDCIHKLNDGWYPTLTGSRFVLTEFDSHEKYDNMKYCVEQITAAGYTPVIAHAERYRKIVLSDIIALKSFGAMIQINAHSIANEKNVQTRRLANDCLSGGLIDFIGSDAHRLDHRPPVVADGIAVIKTQCSENYGREVLALNAANLLHI